MENERTMNECNDGPAAYRITFCPNGMVHLDYGPTTLHFTALGFLKLMARGQETAEKIRGAMEGMQETAVVH